MLFTNKIFFKGLMAFIPFTFLFLACTSDESLRPDVLAFRKQMIEDFYLLKSGLIPALDTNKPVLAAGETIENFLKEIKSDNRKIFGISLLDVSGEYLTGFVIENTTTGKLIKDKYKNMNFHSFKVVERILKSRKIMQERLYFQDARILAIGFPLIKGDDLLGIVCFSFKSHEFEKKWGISEKEFLKIDFGTL